MFWWHSDAESACQEMNLRRIRNIQLEMPTLNDCKNICIIVKNIWIPINKSGKHQFPYNMNYTFLVTNLGMRNIVKSYWFSNQEATQILENVICTPPSLTSYNEVLHYMAQLHIT